MLTNPCILFMSDKIPYSKENDYTRESADSRKAFIKDKTGVDLKHSSQFSLDPLATAGNIENFTGVTQIPLGFAGPLLVHGEHAQGNFYVPMATSEGTLLASYNRGMKKRTAVLGKDYVQSANSGTSDFNAAFQKMITETAWGTVWSGDHWDDRQRSVLTIALLAALLGSPSSVT